MYTEQILNYLDDQMLAEDKLAFEQKLKTDLLLASKVNEIKELRFYAEIKDKSSPSSIAIKEVGAGFDPSKVTTSKPKTKSNIITLLLPVAAAAVLLFGFFIQPLFESQTPTTGIVNYEISPLSFQTRGDDNTDLLSNASTAFNTEMYYDAVLYLDEIIIADQDNQKARLYKAVSLLRLGKHQQAQQVLQLLEHQPQYESASYYYRGLSFLQTSNPELAKRMLEKINEESSYYKRAQEKIKQL